MIILNIIKVRLPVLIPVFALMCCDSPDNEDKRLDKNDRVAILTQRVDQPDELEISLSKIWLPRIFLEEVGFHDALAIGLSRARELGPERPFVFPVNGAELVDEDVKITVDVRDVNFLNYLDIICYQSGLIWSVENKELMFRGR
jgi:hypothetical protein